nr:MAG TPA: hypothetical protein [Bacteriophage sp.]
MYYVAVIYFRVVVLYEIYITNNKPTTHIG